MEYLRLIQFKITQCSVKFYVIQERNEDLDFLGVGINFK